MNIHYSRLLCLSAVALAACQADQSTEAVRPPNIVIFYVDDLGYGDVGSYGAIGVETPNIDHLAANGVRFTDAHSSAATCTPSRYSLLTGEHGFRRNARILRGDAPLLIPVEKPTLPAMLKRAGYTTAVVGKWHLGLGDGDLDWNESIRPGPLEIGFDYAFLLPATGDRVPTVYVEDHQVVNLDPADPIEVSYKNKVGNRPTGYENPELLRYETDGQHNKTIVNGVSRIGHMAGGESALWIDELEVLGIADRTLLIFTSDNGPVLNDGYEDQTAELVGDHKPAGPLRGSKYSAFEGGFSKVPQLYDLSADIGEQLNLAEKNPELVGKLQLQLDRIVGETY